MNHRHKPLPPQPSAVERMEKRRKAKEERQPKPNYYRQEQYKALRFNYADIAEEHREMVQRAAVDIGMRLKRSTEDIILIGQQFMAVRELLPNNKFGAWLHQEFDLTHRMAQNYMNVAMVYGNNHGEIISLFSPTTLYLLAAPGVPDIVRREARSLALSEQRRPSVQEIRQLVARYAERLQPVSTTILFHANESTHHELPEYRNRPIPCSIQFDGVLPKKGQMVIYGLTDPRNDEIYYVGATSNFKKRMEAHVRDVPTGHWAAHLSQEEINRLEWERFTFHSRKKREIYNAGVHTIVQILDYAESYEAAQELETSYIRKYVPSQGDSAGIREPSYPFVPPPPPQPVEPDAISAEYTVLPKDEFIFPGRSLTPDSVGLIISRDLAAKLQDALVHRIFRVLLNRAESDELLIALTRALEE